MDPRKQYDIVIGEYDDFPESEGGGEGDALMGSIFDDAFAMLSPSQQVAKAKAAISSVRNVGAPARKIVAKKDRPRTVVQYAPKPKPALPTFFSQRAVVRYAPKPATAPAPKPVAPKPAALKPAALKSPARTRDALDALDYLLDATMVDEGEALLEALTELPDDATPPTWADAADYLAEQGFEDGASLLRSGASVSGPLSFADVPAPDMLLL